MSSASKRGENRRVDPYQLYSVAEVAECLDVSQQTIRRMITRRELPFGRFGRCRRISGLALHAIAGGAIRVGLDREK